MAKNRLISFQNFNEWYAFLKMHPLAYASTDFIATMILVFFLFLVAVRPTALEIVSLQKKVRDMTTYNQKLENKKRVLERLILQYQEIESSIPLIDRAIPSKPNVTQFTRQIVYLLDKHHVSLNNISFSDYPLISAPEATKKSTLNYMATKEQFTLSIKANYDDMKLFLGDAVQQLRITSIDQVSFNTGSENTVIVTLTGEAYYLN